jgi:hypothetical protein
VKKKNKILIIVFSGLLFASFSPSVSFCATYANANFNFDVLKGQGEWIVHPAFGKVWKPFVNDDWRPFHYGKWIRTNIGWEWVAYEPWGWLVFHYGNWFWQSTWGWYWTPGYDWSAAPVSWIELEDSIGWGPLPPPGHYLPDPWEPNAGEIWNVISKKDFGDSDLTSKYKKQISRPANNFKTLRSAPDPQELEKMMGKNIPLIAVGKKMFSVMSAEQTNEETVGTVSKDDGEEEAQRKTRLPVEDEPEKTEADENKDDSNKEHRSEIEIEHQRSMTDKKEFATTGTSTMSESRKPTPQKQTGIVKNESRIAYQFDRRQYPLEIENEIQHQQTRLVNRVLKRN